MTTYYDNYSDIIDMPHHQSTRHPHMSRTKRAAQFAAVTSFVGLNHRTRKSETSTHCTPSTLQWIHDPDFEQTDTWIE